MDISQQRSQCSSKRGAEMLAVADSEFQLNAEDRPQEECGVFGIYAPGVDVARRAFFGIFALQHRGQESSGIAVTDGTNMPVHTGMGLVSQVFDDDTISKLRGHIAVAHTRYSTTGSSSVCNTQPLRVQTSDGELALAHNGNLVNAAELRTAMEAEGVEFFTSMDTEVIGKSLNRIAISPWKRPFSKRCARCAAPTRW